MMLDVQQLDEGAAATLVHVALDCIAREYPNKISHVLSRDEDALPPRRLTPAFFGCYDWHSAVHNHWLLVRLVCKFPRAKFSPGAIEALANSLSDRNIAAECNYLNGDGRQSFERPYGLAWLLQLALELNQSKDLSLRDLAKNLGPLVEIAKQRVSAWLPKLPYPVRTGEHNQSAFALGLMIDYARSCKDEDEAFLALMLRRTREFYFGDKDWPLHYEPAGEDFLSPGLGEADLMRRVLPPQEYKEWLGKFLPEMKLFQPVASPDPSDPKFSHLDGLNLSRAWMLEGIASAMTDDDPRRRELLQSAEAHAQAGLQAAAATRNYVGSHWLGTFAVYLLTRRGIGA